MKSESIADHLTIGNNSFGVLRLLAASAVVFSHSWTVTGGNFAIEPLHSETGYNLGWHAVNLFFALSGLLIAGSLEHSRSIIRFVWSRFLRIFPALVTVVIATVLISAMFVNPEDWDRNSAIYYLIRNLFLVGGSATIPGVFETNPSPGEINVPLWTLKYEIAAYCSIALVSSVCLTLANQKVFRYAVLLILGVSAVTMPFFGEPEAYGRIEHGVRLAFAFYLGVAAWQWRQHLSARGSVLILLFAINLILLWNDIDLQPIQIVCLAYAGLYFGIRNYGWISKLTDQQDYSYGVYIIGYPIQQSVVAFTNNHDPWINFAISMPIILGLAMCSWNLVEKPALSLKKWNFVLKFERQKPAGTSI